MKACFRVVLAMGWVLTAASLARPAEPAEQPQTIQQGGYVEKVEPGVDYRDRLPRIAPRAPEQSLQGFHIIPGYRIELAAAEPLIADAVDLAFDEFGRLFVCEMIPYAEESSSKFGSPLGRVSRLEDTDGDGRFDRSTIYADGLVWPTGVACYGGGIFVASAPDLWYFRDDDGDGRADRREQVLTGFDTSNPNAVPNSLRWGLDGRIHGMTSTAGGLLRAVKWERAGHGPAEPVQSRGRDFSIDPRTGELRLESGGSQFGLTWDAWGRKYESSNSAPIEQVMYDERYLARNPFLAAPTPRVPVWADGNTVYRTSPPEPWRVVRTEMRVRGAFSGPTEGGVSTGYFTSACGVTIYTGHLFPADSRGDAFVCEGAGNLVHRMRVDASGVVSVARRVEPGREFLTSDEVWFRPIQFAEYADGALYLADMYREIYEHPDAVPPSLKKYIDLTAGKDRGRIWRIVPEGARQAKPPRLGTCTPAELVPLLAHANGWVRGTAGRLLVEKHDLSVLDALHRLAAESPQPLARMHALWTLRNLAGLTADDVLPRLSDAHPRVREHAVRLAEEVLADAPAVRARLLAMTDDADPRVRYQLAFTLGELSERPATEALARLAARDAGESWVRLAVLSSSLGRAGELAAILCEDDAWRGSKEAKTLLVELAEQAGLQGRADQVAEVVRVLDRLQRGDRGLAQTIVRGLSQGLEKSGSPLRSQLGGGSLAGRMLAELIARSQEAAGREDLPLPERVEAVRSLALAPWDDVESTLDELLESRQPQEVQLAALHALGRFQGEGVAETILAHWAGFSPTVRTAAAETLFARTERLGALLVAVADETVFPRQLDPARVKYLLQHPDPALRAEAERLLGGATLARRDEAVAAYRACLDLPADVARGREVFRRECTTCHKLEGVGFDLGLPLASVRSRGRDGILMQVLDPNREVNPSYLNYTILTDAGLSITGMITAETATSITLTRAENQSDTVLRTNIDELVNSGVSIMPEGLEDKVTPQEMADLIEYLMTVE